ncbi:MAG TPA: hypothetical protein VGQ83_38885 [Polyangia bacterium]
MRDRRRRTDPQASPTPTLVLLLASERKLDRRELEAAAERAYGSHFPGGDDAQEFVTGDNPFVVKVSGHLVLVTSAPNPVVDAPQEFAQALADPALRRRFGEHRAVLSFICMHTPAKDERATYTHMAKLVAELVEDALLLYVEEFRGLVEVTSGLAARLRTEDVVAAVPEAFEPPKTVAL